MPDISSQRFKQCFNMCSINICISKKKKKKKKKKQKKKQTNKHTHTHTHTHKHILTFSQQYGLAFHCSGMWHITGVISSQHPISLELYSFAASSEMSGTNYPLMQDHIPEECSPLTHHFITTSSPGAKKTNLEYYSKIRTVFNSALWVPAKHFHSCK
jgi:hypothetical protein